MTDYQIKLAAKLPKGDPNGLDDFELITTLHQQQTEGRGVQPRAAVFLYDVEDAGVNANGVHWVKLRIRQVEPVATVSGRKAVQQILSDEFAARTGQAVPPWEVVQLARAAFRDLPRSIEEIDADEERERDRMSPADELRRHLEVIHGVADARTLTDGEAEERHRKDHDGDALPEPLKHEPGWIGWSRADLEQAEIAADDLPQDDEFDRQVERGDNMPTLFDSGADVEDYAHGGSPLESSDPDQ